MSARTIVYALSAAALVVSEPQLAVAQRLPAMPFEKTISDMHIRMATSYLDQIAATIFRENGERYVTPRVTGYDNTVMTGCGRIEADNAYACRSDRTIYYDRTFLAGLVSAASSQLKTDGDMAAIYAIAHEWGHQLQFLLGLDYTNAVDRSESDADCLAGVLLGRAQALGKLRVGAMAEARFAIAFVGDSVLVPGVWGKTIERINASAAGSIPVITNATGYHGNPDERLAAFNLGLATNMHRCVEGIPRPGRAAAASTITWYVNNTADAYDLGVAQHKPIVLVTGDFSAPYFQRLKNEVFSSTQLAQLAPYAIFVYADPSHDIAAKRIGKAVGYDKWPVISLLAPNGRALDEEARIVGLWDAQTVTTQLSIHMRSNGWLPSPTTPWMPTRPTVPR